MTAASKQTILVAGVSLSGEEKDYLKSCVGLADLLGAKLVLAHAILPFQSYAYAGEGAFYPVANYETGFRELSEAKAMEEFEALVQFCREQSQTQALEIDTRVVHADPALGLASLAKELHASMILCGHHQSASKSDLFGMSTAFLLMAEASTPVMSLPIERLSPLSSSSDVRVLIADEITRDEPELLQQASPLLAQFKPVSITHMHVSPLSDREIDHMVATIKNGMILGRFPSDAQFNRQSYLEGTKQAIADQLQRRYEATMSTDKGQTHYQALASFGDPREQIHKAAEQTNANLLVFGRHHIFHRKTLSSGNLPYHGMTSLNLPVLVLPCDS